MLTPPIQKLFIPSHPHPHPDSSFSDASFHLANFCFIKMWNLQGGSGLLKRSSQLNKLLMNLKQITPLATASLILW